MKRQIRRNVFETNSSSMHSLTVKKGTMENSNLLIDDTNNKVVSGFGEYGWEIENYTSQSDKLRYILTMCACTEGKILVSPDEFYDTEGFKLISEAIANHCCCDGVEIAEGSMKTDHWKDNYYLDFDGYIDHQSYEDYASVAEFLSKNNIGSVEEFVFSNGIIVHTDNDNH